MYHLRLIKGLSYHGVVSATAKHPDVYTDDEAVYAAALASGYFEDAGPKKGKNPETPTAEVFQEPEAAEPEEERTYVSEHATELSKMTVTELKQYAAIKGISLKENLKKDTIIKTITKAEEKADAIRKAYRDKK